MNNYPNPFNPNTTITFNIELLEQNEQVNLTISNMKGQIVKSYENVTKGSVDWNGKDENENPVGSGIYFYNISVGDYSKSAKMILLK